MNNIKLLTFIGVLTALFGTSVLRASPSARTSAGKLTLDWVPLSKIDKCHRYNLEDCSMTDDTKNFEKDGVQYTISTQLTQLPLQIKVTATEVATGLQLFSGDVYTTFPGYCLEKPKVTYASAGGEDWPAFSSRGKMVYLSCGRTEKSIVLINLKSGQAEVVRQKPATMPTCGNYVVPTSDALTTHGLNDPYPDYSGTNKTDWIQFDPAAGQVLRQMPCQTTDGLILDINPKSIGNHHYVWSPSATFPWGHTSGINPITMLRTWTQPENLRIRWVDSELNSETAVVLAEHKFFNGSNETIFRTLSLNLKTGAINWGLDNTYIAKRDFLGTSAPGIDLFKATFPISTQSFYLVRGFNPADGTYLWKTTIPFYNQPLLPGLTCASNTPSSNPTDVRFFCQEADSKGLARIFELLNVDATAYRIKFRIRTNRPSWEMYQKTCVLEYTVDNGTGALLNVDDPIGCLD